MRIFTVVFLLFISSNLFAQKSLFPVVKVVAKPEVIHEIVKFENKHFEHITPIYKHNTLEDVKSIHKQEKEKMLVGKLLKVESIEKKFLLNDYGITVLLPDSANYGYDTAQITDHYFRLKIQTMDSTSYFYCRMNKMLGDTIFEVGNNYLFSFNEYRGENWIEIKSIYHKNYQPIIYFKPYDEQD